MPFKPFKTFKQFQSFKMEFRPTGEPEIAGETARVACVRTVVAVDQQGPHPNQTNVTVALRKRAGHWDIESIE